MRDIYREYQSIRLVVNRGDPISDIAEQVFRLYFVYVSIRYITLVEQKIEEGVVTRREQLSSPTTHILGNDEDEELLRRRVIEVDNNIHSKGEVVLQKVLRDRVPSLFFVMENAFSATTQLAETYPIQRLLILAILTKRLELVKIVIQTFPGIIDLNLINRLLQPFIDPNVDSYAQQYLSLFEPKIVPTNPVERLNNAIITLGKIRIRQSIMLRKLIAARYQLVQVISSPNLFDPSSLSSVNRLLTEVRVELKGEDTREFTPFNNILNVTADNYDRVNALMEVGNLVTKQAMRRLDLLLTVVQRTASLKRRPGEEEPEQREDIPVTSIVNFSVKAGTTGGGRVMLVDRKKPKEIGGERRISPMGSFLRLR